MMSNVTLKSHLAYKLSEKGYEIADANKAVDDLLECMEDALASGRTLKLVGFGNLSAEVIPQSKKQVAGELRTVGPYVKVTFKASPKLKQRILNRSGLETKASQELKKFTSGLL